MQSDFHKWLCLFYLEVRGFEPLARQMLANRLPRKTWEGTRRPFTVSEIRSVIDVADKEWRSLVLFGLYTGQRLADLATLRWDNIDLARNEIRIKTWKTGNALRLQLRRRSKLTLRASQPIVKGIFVQRRQLQSQAKNASV